MLNISHNYINEESFKADIFADMRTLDTVDLQRNRSVKSAVTVFMVEDDDGLHTYYVKLQYVFLLGLLGQS